MHESDKLLVEFVLGMLAGLALAAYIFGHYGNGGGGGGGRPPIAPAPFGGLEIPDYVPEVWLAAADGLP